jgi:hypothetical protein
VVASAVAQSGQWFRLMMVLIAIFVPAAPSGEFDVGDGQAVSDGDREAALMWTAGVDHLIALIVFSVAIGIVKPPVTAPCSE